MKRKKRIKHWQLYLFLVIPIVLVFIFNYIPMAGIQLAFKKYNMNLGIMGSPWIGFDNFKKFFRNYQFWRLLKNTLTLSLYGMLAGFPIPIMLALLLNSMNNLKYKKFIQTVTYMPHFISTVVMVGLIIQVFNPRIGLYGIIYSAVTGNNAPDVLGSASAFPHIYVLPGSGSRWAGIRSFIWRPLPEWMRSCMKRRRWTGRVSFSVFCILIFLPSCLRQLCF